MFRKNYLISVLTIALFLVGGVAAFSQNASFRGKVELTKADGTKVPVAGALVEVYRIDVKTNLPSTKTDKKGIFAFVGLPLSAQIVFSVSAPGIKPEIQSGIRIKGDNPDILIPVTEGDGGKYTEDQVRLAVAGSSSTQSTGLTAEQKKANEELEKKRLEIENRNKKAEETNKIVNSALQEGNKAYLAKNYDLAIAKFDEGYNADQTFAGSAPVMLNNKAAALINRGGDTFNASVKADPATKATALASVKQDFTDAVIASDKTLEVLKDATSSDANVQKDYALNKFKALLNRKNAYRLLAQTGADRTKGKEALAAFQEYIAAETDPPQKSKAQIDLAQTLQDSDEYELAIAEFKKILETDPNNVDALVGVGLNLVTAGYVTMDTDAAKGKSQLQEAANYLQRFVDVAPATHKLLESVKASIADLKSTQNVAPTKVKTTTTTKKKN